MSADRLRTIKGWLDGDRTIIVGPYPNGVHPNAVVVRRVTEDDWIKACRELYRELEGRRNVRKGADG